LAKAGVKAGVKQIAKRNIQTFYHGSPVRFNQFDANFIGSGEGGSKAMEGINLFRQENMRNAPKFANIRSSDAPLHLGSPSKSLTQQLNPTVYTVEGKGLKLYETPSAKKARELGFTQEELVKHGYHGISTPSQVTVFPEHIKRLNISNSQSIPDFVKSNPQITD